MLALYLALEALAVMLNAAFAYMVWFKSTVSSTIKYLLLNLICANVALNFLYIIWDITDALNITGNRALCVTQFLMNQASFYTTLCTVATISMERLLAMRSPLSYQRGVFLKTYRLVIPLAIWLITLLLSLPGLPDYFRNESRYCLALDLYPTQSIILFVTITSVLLFVNIVLFGLIAQSLLNYASTWEGSRSSLKRKALRASTIALASAVFYFTIISPVVAFFFWFLTNPCDEICLETNPFYKVVDIFAYLFTVGDPIIFFFSLIPGRTSRVQPNQPPPCEILEVAMANNQVFNLRPKCYRNFKSEVKTGKNLQPRPPTMNI